ncbi:MAG: hypothetical protein IB618_01030 [Candidatus Pacearchaeota archaeon]|nr:MAG: hypothetical protein IB618_01030 [Candidatus Pacearchaeota archaeon]
MPAFQSYYGIYRLGKVLFDLKGLENGNGILATIRVNKTLIPLQNQVLPMHTLCGICNEYIIELRKKKLYIRKVNNNDNGFFFYGREQELKDNFNSRKISDSLKWELHEFMDKKIQHGPRYIPYYKIPLNKIDLDLNKLLLIDLVFKNIKRLIKKIPDKLEKKVLNGRNFTRNLNNYPKDFVEEIKKEGYFYYLNLPGSRLYSSKKIFAQSNQK